jgi:hypothetical protein
VLGRFKVVSIDGRAPRPAETGWKDVVWLGPDQTIRVPTEFPNFTGSDYGTVTPARAEIRLRVGFED